MPEKKLKNETLNSTNVLSKPVDTRKIDVNSTERMMISRNLENPIPLDVQLDFYNVTQGMKQKNISFQLNKLLVTASDL